MNLNKNIESPNKGCSIAEGVKASFLRNLSLQVLSREQESREKKIFKHLYFVSSTELRTAVSEKIMSLQSLFLYLN